MRKNNKGTVAPARPTSHRGKRARTIAFAVGIGLGSFLAYQYWPLLQGLIKPGSRQAVPEAVIKEPAPQPIPPASIAQSDPALAGVGTASSISPEPLPLVLVGTIPGRNAREGSAMLGSDARNAQTFLAGALLENGARLAEIYRDRVILERNGERATLYLRGDGRARTELSALLKVGGESVQPPKKVSYSVDPVTDYIRAIPFYKDDVVAGFRVFPGTRSAPFNDWGLRAGDIIVSLDGSPLVDGDQATQLLSALAQGAALSARIMRGSDAITVSLDGSAITKLNQTNTAPQVAMQPPP